MLFRSRRSWARNPNSIKVVKEWNRKNEDRGHITEPQLADDDLIEETVRKYDC